MDFQKIREDISSIESGAHPVSGYYGASLMNSPWALMNVEGVEEEVVQVISEEKKETITAFARFAHENIDKSETNTHLFTGGLVTKKDESSKDFTLKLDLNALGSTEGLNFLLKSIGLDTVDVAFIGDDKSLEEENGDLLSKMIMAMKLTEKSFVRGRLYKLESGDLDFDKSKQIYQELYLLKPKVIIALGAQATNFFLEKKEKLSKVHGQFFDRKVEFSSGELFEYKLFPVFHPDFLEINPKMKRTAWIDLQKIMDFLGLS